VPRGPVHMTAYQNLAALTDEDAADGIDPLSLGVPMLGLAGEAGTLLVAQKKAYRDKDPMASTPAFVAEELGDLLWYAATVARRCDLDLDAVASASVDRAEALRTELALLHELPPDLPVLDEGYPTDERFPRHLVVRVRQRRAGAQVFAALTVVDASPNAFPDGPVTSLISGKPQGFAIGKPLGSELTDNSRRADDYRFHDAIHLGFLAVMGWSPVMRALLQLKRRSASDVDENEDGARAIFAEEGLAALLAKRASALQGFAVERAVDDETVQMFTTVLEDLEVARMPAWLWRRAVTQGFTAMRKLAAERGGFLIVDLDARSLSYRKTPPRSPEF
jgi:hypothetical protein